MRTKGNADDDAWTMRHLHAPKIMACNRSQRTATIATLWLNDRATATVDVALYHVAETTSTRAEFAFEALSMRTNFFGRKQPNT